MPKFPCPTCKGSGCIKLIAGGIDNDCYLCKGKMRIDVGGPEHKLLLHDKTMDALFKEAFFTSVIRFEFSARAIVVKKQVIHSQRLRNFKENFYNYIIMQVLKHNGGVIKNAKLKFDKRGEKTLRDQLRVYLSEQLDNKNKHIFSDLKFVDSFKGIFMEKKFDIDLNQIKKISELKK